jgi:ribosomal protein S18 acetylase RimI-like enzyme
MTLRAAKSDDVNQLAELHRDAFDGTIGAAAGIEYARSFVRWFMNGPDRAAIVADDGSPQGYVIGAPNGYGPRITRELAADMARGVLRHLPSVVLHPRFQRQVRARAAHLFLRRDPRGAIHDATPPDAFCLVGIATHRDARGKGFGKALVNALCDHARRVGATSVVLDVFEQNQPAVALYHSVGFTVLQREHEVQRMIRRLATEPV